jgi:hypothetical protein
VTQVPCPKCEAPLLLPIGLQIPSLPQGTAWRCKVPGCEQWLVLTLVRTTPADPWEVRAFAMTPSECRIKPEPEPQWIVVTFHRGGARVAYGPWRSAKRRDVALEAWRRDPLVSSAELAIKPPPDTDRTAVRA